MDERSTGLSLQHTFHNNEATAGNADTTCGCVYWIARHSDRHPSMNNARFAINAFDRTHDRFTVLNEQKRPSRLSFDIHSSSRIVDVGRTRSKKEELMRSYSLLAGLLVLAGCSSNGEWTSGGVGEPTGTPKATGSVEQKAQFADATLLNLVDPGNTTIAITADGQPTTVQVFYSGDKTTDSGRTASAPVLVDTITLDTDQTGRHNVNLSNPAF